MTNEKAREVLQEQIDRYGQEYDAEGIEALEIAIKALEQQRYKPIILQEHDAEPRTMRAILDTATYEIYVCKLTRQGAEILGMTIEEVDSE